MVFPTFLFRRLILTPVTAPPFLASLLLASLLLSLSPPTATAQSDAAHQQFLFAYRLLQRGENAMAAEAFDEYLTRFPRDPKHSDALYYRALLHRRGGENAAAARLLTSATTPTLVPAHAIHLLNGQVLCDLRQYGPAITALSQVDLEALTPEVAVSARYLLGLAYRGDGRLDAAAKTLGDAATITSPLRGQALLDLARVQVLLDRPAEAIATLDRVLDVATGSTAAQAARLAGDLTQQAGQFDPALAYYQLVITEHPASDQFGPAVLGTLWSQFGSHRYRQLLETERRFREAIPEADRITATYLAGSAHRELEEHAQATERLAAIARGEGRYPLLEKVLYKLAASQFDLKAYEPLQQTVARLAQLYPESPLLIDCAFLLATADADQGHVTRGAARLTQLIDRPDAAAYRQQALLRRARLYEDHQRPDAALSDYRQFTAEADTTSDLWQQTMLRRIDLAYRQGQLQEAQTAAADLLRQPQLPPQIEQEALFRGALTQIQLGEAADALTTLQLLDRKHPLHPYPAASGYYRGLLLVSLNRAPEAQPLLEAAAADESLDGVTRINALRLTALHLREAGQDAAARQALQRIEALGTIEALRSDERLELGRHHLAAKRPDEAVRYLALAQDSREGLYFFGQALRHTGQGEKALDAFGKVIAGGGPLEHDAQLALAATLVDAGQWQRGLDEYAVLLNVGTSRLEATAAFEMGRVHRLIAEERRRREDTAAAQAALDQARRLFKRVLVLYAFPELDPLPQRSSLQLADLALASGERDEALTEYRQLLEKFPEGPYATFARAQLAWERKRPEEAAQLLASLPADHLDADLAARVQRAREQLTDSSRQESRR